MVVIATALAQGAQMALVLLLPPLLLGLVRKLKARLLSRRGPSLLQPYRDLTRLMRCSRPMPPRCFAWRPI